MTEATWTKLPPGRDVGEARRPEGVRHGARDRRPTRSAGHGAAPADAVVRVPLPRATPRSPMPRVRRSTVRGGPPRFPHGGAAAGPSGPHGRRSWRRGHAGSGGEGPVAPTPRARPLRIAAPRRARWARQVDGAIGSTLDGRAIDPVPQGIAGQGRRRADRLDPGRALTIVDAGDPCRCRRHRLAGGTGSTRRVAGFDRRSSPATAKDADVLRRIPLARRRSRIPRSGAFTRSRSSLAAPGRPGPPRPAPPRRARAPVLHHQPRGPRPRLRWAPRPPRRRSILSRTGASGEPGAVQPGTAGAGAGRGFPASSARTDRNRRTRGFSAPAPRWLTAKKAEP